jgi:hypothetical protein
MVTAVNGSPEKLLDKLRAQLQESEINAQREAKRAKDAKADLDALVKARGEIDKAVDAYRSQVGDLQETLDDLWKYRNERYEPYRRAVGDARAQELDVKIDEFEEALKRTQDALEADRTERAKAKSERDRRTADLEASRTQFAALIERVKRINDRFKSLEALKAKLDEADDAALHERKYVLIREFDFQVRNTGRDPGDPWIIWHPPTPVKPDPLYSADAYRDKLLNAWRDLDAKQTALRVAENAEVELDGRIERRQKILASYREERVDPVLNPDAPPWYGLEPAPAPAPDDDGDNDGNGNGDDGDDGDDGEDGDNGDGDEYEPEAEQRTPPDDREEHRRALA